MPFGRPPSGSLSGQLSDLLRIGFPGFFAIQREYSEEFLGNPEHDGNSVDPIDYEHDEPFRSFAAAHEVGDFRIFAMAVALCPLSLSVDLLTVAVIEAPVFDRLFAGMVSVNEEGAAVSTVAGRPVFPSLRRPTSGCAPSHCPRSPAPASSWPGNTATPC